LPYCFILLVKLSDLQILEGGACHAIISLSYLKLQNKEIDAELEVNYMGFTFMCDPSVDSPHD
jgi:hypothetical protein